MLAFASILFAGSCKKQDAATLSVSFNGATYDYSNSANIYYALDIYCFCTYRELVGGRASGPAGDTFHINEAAGVVQAQVSLVVDGGRYVSIGALDSGYTYEAVRFDIESNGRSGSFHSNVYLASGGRLSGPAIPISGSFHIPE